MSAGRILVIRGGAIGDFLLTLPALRAIRNAFPQSKVEILGYPKIADLARFAGLADDAKAIEAPALAGFFAAKGTLDEDWMEYFSRFDVILSYLYDPDGIFQDNIRRCRRTNLESDIFNMHMHMNCESNGTHKSAPSGYAGCIGGNTGP